MSDNESVDIYDNKIENSLYNRALSISEIPEINCNKEDLDYLLTSLEVISQINIGDKLAWWDEKIPNIQNNGPFRFIRRWLSEKDDRNTCILNIKEIVYKSINGFKFKDTKGRLKESLVRSIAGLNNLKLTYDSDKQIVSQLNIITQNISKIISND